MLYFYTLLLLWVLFFFLIYFSTISSHSLSVMLSFLLCVFRLWFSSKFFVPKHLLHKSQDEQSPCQLLKWSIMSFLQLKMQRSQLIRLVSSFNGLEQVAWFFWLFSILTNIFTMSSTWVSFFFWPYFVSMSIFGSVFETLSLNFSTSSLRSLTYLLCFIWMSWTAPKAWDKSESGCHHVTNTSTLGFSRARI